MAKTLKIILAILLFLCLLDMPYGFYQIIRFISLVGFSFLAYRANEQQNKRETFICISLALLFQPLYKIALGREIWNIIDVIVGSALILSLFIQSNKKNDNINHEK